MTEVICSVEGCGFPARADGLCNAHYSHKRRYGTPTASKRKRKRRDPQPCSEAGCSRIQYAKGYCRMHYTRLSRNGSTELKRKRRSAEPESAD